MVICSCTNRAWYSSRRFRCFGQNINGAYKMITIVCISFSSLDLMLVNPEDK